MAAVGSYVYRGECAPLTQAETAASSVLAEYVAPLEIVFKEWYLASYAAVRNSAIMCSAEFPDPILLAGSRADGLSLPDVLPLGDDAIVLADYDKMFPNVGRRWRDNEGKAVTKVGSVALEPVAADPRYYRLIPDPEWRNDLRQRHPSYDGGYLPNRYFVNPLGHGWAGAKVDVQGPAVRMVSGLQMSHQQDTVQSIQLDAWPSAIAADWLHRFRPSGWPDERLVSDLVDSAPLFLTPTGRSDSPTEEAIEWRLSFSLPERRLALSLTAAQRTAYVLVKTLMKKKAGSGVDGGGAASFRTFYLKNALFWACETEPADTWRRPADGARALLARVERCSTDGRLPSYFVPASNLLDREGAEALLAAASRARQLSYRPLRALRFIATPRHSFLSLGIVDYEPLWRWVDAEAVAAEAANPERAAKLAPDVPTSFPAQLSEPAPTTGGERVLTFLFAAYARLLKGMESSLKVSLGDRDLSLIARVTRSLIASVAARLAIDIYSHRRRQYLATLGGGRYVLSHETSVFEAFARSLLKEHGIVSDDHVSDNLVLHSRALLRNRLSGHDELSSGSFPPVTERHMCLIAAQSALTQPIDNIAATVMNDIRQLMQTSSLQTIQTNLGHLLRELSLK